MDVIWPDFGRISALKTHPKFDGKRDGHFYGFWMDFGVDLGPKMTSKINKKINENLIVFWKAILIGQVPPTRLQLSGPGCREGVGEGSRY